jgi:hypothetical protein
MEQSICSEAHIASQLVKKFHFSGTPSFINLFARAHHRTCLEPVETSSHPSNVYCKLVKMLEVGDNVSSRGTLFTVISK